MRRNIPALLIVLTLAVASGQAPPEGGNKGASRVIVPDDKVAARDVIKEWLETRGIDSEVNNEALVVRRKGIAITVLPLVFKGELDRLRVSVLYHPKDEFKGTKELLELVTRLNRSQNLLQVFLTEDFQYLVAAGNLTFYDELTAHEYDAFMDLFIDVVQQYVLIPDAVKMLK